jgi:nitrile hydratase beta subunit
MNGPQDLGGQMGFGLVAPEIDEPVFHAAWEKRALGLTLCAGALGKWTIDESRHARESLHPADYYASSYYEIWTKALEVLLRRHGFITAADLAAQRAVDPAPGPMRILTAGNVAATLARGGPCDRPMAAPPLFAAGDRVRTRRTNPTGHTRLPRYARDCVGVIEAVHGGFVFPDTNAHGAGEAQEYVYTVAFTGEELWGETASSGLTVSIDAWESYLVPA